MKKFIITILSILILSKINAYTFTHEIEEELKIKEQAGIFYEHTQITSTLKYNKLIQPFVGYRLEFEDKKGNGLVWNQKQSILFGNNITVLDNDAYGKLNLKSQFEYAFISGGNNDFRLRERLKYNTPWKFTKLEINPFIFDEMFFDLYSNNGFNQNRAGTGLDFKIYKNLSGSIFYYLNNQKKNNDWSNANTIVIQSKIKF